MRRPGGIASPLGNTTREDSLVIFPAELRPGARVAGVFT